MSFRKVRILSLLLFNIFSEFNTLFLKKKNERHDIRFFLNVKVLVTQSCPHGLTPWTVAHKPPLPMEFSR